MEAAPLSLITGGAGFVGCNLAQRILASGARVRVFIGGGPQHTTSALLRTPVCDRRAPP